MFKNHHLTINMSTTNHRHAIVTISMTPKRCIAKSTIMEIMMPRQLWGALLSEELVMFLIRIIRDSLLLVSISKSIIIVRIEYKL